QCSNPLLSTCLNDYSFYIESYYYIDDLSLYDRGYYSGSARCARDTFICPGASVIIGANIPDSASYYWSPPTALSCTNCPNPVATPTTTTTYYLQKQLCSFTTYDAITINVASYPSPANAGEDKKICPQEITTIGISDTAAIFTTYAWSPTDYLSCSFCPQTEVNINTKDSVWYVLTKTFCDSISTDTVLVISESCPSYTIPNVFTPNEDGVNDNFSIQIEAYQSFSYAIFDRWGLLMKQGDIKINRDTTKYILWDGKVNNKPATDGVYYYVIELINSKKEIETIKGHIELLR
ncbi:MAG: gliding motility-associated C-terminal domain-containing protein, partial [Deferribacterales bacterium]